MSGSSGSVKLARPALLEGHAIVVLVALVTSLAVLVAVAVLAVLSALVALVALPALVALVDLLAHIVDLVGGLVGSLALGRILQAERIEHRFGFA